MRQDTPNARLWLCTEKGPVKLTLTPGQRLRFSSDDEPGGKETFTGTQLEYQADTGRILMEVTTRACDCSLETWDDYIVDIEDLKGIPSIKDPEVQFPSWFRWAGAEYDPRTAPAGY